MGVVVPDRGFARCSSVVVMQLESEGSQAKLVVARKAVTIEFGSLLTNHLHDSLPAIYFIAKSIPTRTPFHHKCTSSPTTNSTSQRRDRDRPRLSRTRRQLSGSPSCGLRPKKGRATEPAAPPTSSRLTIHAHHRCRITRRSPSTRTCPYLNSQNPLTIASLIARISHRMSTTDTPTPPQSRIHGAYKPFRRCLTAQLRVGKT